MNRILLFAFLSLAFNLLSQEPQSIKAFLGHEIGSQFSRHNEVVSYYEKLHLSFPERTKIQKYGETNEGRKLFLFVIGNKENISQLDDLKTRHLMRDTSLSLPIIWLSYNVHGNESSGTEASMETAFRLLTEKSDWLNQSIVIIDPCLNPDGRDRYVNFFKQYASSLFNVDPLSIEHKEPWPGGRFNHYLFDLNRDWAWLTQVESQQRIKVYNQWMPHVYVDFHEQGYNEPYYFPPAAEPFHEIITDWQREFQERIGKNHAKYFDKEGWLYFSKETFDLLYPSYGDTYPMYNGAIGMTYEQAGSGRAGKGIVTNSGDTLTLRDRIEHHITTGLSTIEVSLNNQKELLENYRTFHLNRDYKYDYYILRGDSYKLKKLKELLNTHDIEFGHVVNEEKFKAWSFNTQKEEDVNINSFNDLVVSTNQVKGPLIEVLFEPETYLSDSLTYDITAWSLPYAYGLEAFAYKGALEIKLLIENTELNQVEMPNCYAYLCTWNSMNSASFLQSILAQNIAVKVAEKEFQIDGQIFPVGTLVIPRGINQDISKFDELLLKAGSQAQISILPVASGYVTKGKDFGSSSYKELGLPKVGVLSGGDLSPLNTGEIWHFLEKELKMPFRMFRVSDLKGQNTIEDLDVILLPEGSIDSDKLSQLKVWIENGGRLMVFGDAAYNFTEGFDLTIRELEQDYSATDREELSSMITGAIYKCELNSHPLAYGYNRYFSLRQSASNFSLKNGETILKLPSDAKQVSGFVGSLAKENQGDAMVLGIERFGAGDIVYFCDNPLFRGFWENGKLMVANALYFGN